MDTNVNMKEKLQECLDDFILENALILTDQMHEIDAQRYLTDKEDYLWEQLRIKIETARGTKFFIHNK